MRNHFTGSILTLASVLAAQSLAPKPASAQQTGTAEKAHEELNRASIILPKAGSPPPPRLPDGHVDLGNGKGSWYPALIRDITGHGAGDETIGPRKKGPQQV